MNFRTIIISVVLSLILLILLIIFDPLNVNLKSNGLENIPNVVFTKSSLKVYDGIDGNKAYIAVNGIVYDVTDINDWESGTHNGINAGKDVSSEFEYSHHGNNILNRLKKVGTYKERKNE
ncbi:cytochrome b5 domain-containing protein [Leuconostoc carnosum]|uniref:cytochrome b5 domain-containing protein n=1 Tax=Leuconostoc carnosum TaxID=1252 RepID=UPI00168023F5|nr:cytochrome b5 domain-containing protein [Leuconostoc carnosum]